MPAEKILHVVRTLRGGAGAGHLLARAPVILPAAELDQLLDALLVGAKVAAMHCGFITDMNVSCQTAAALQA